MRRLRVTVRSCRRQPAEVFESWQLTASLIVDDERGGIAKQSRLVEIVKGEIARDLELVKVWQRDVIQPC